MWVYILLAVCLGWFVRELIRWRAVRAARSTVAGATEVMSRAQIAGGELQNEVVTLRGVVEAERRRSDAYLGKIEEVIGERDDRFSRAQREASGAAVAQDMMLREIENLATQYERLCKAILTVQTLDEAKKLARRSARRNRALVEIIGEVLGPERAAALFGQPAAPVAGSTPG